MTNAINIAPRWLALLPPPLRGRIVGQPNLQTILSNSGWLLGDKILRMGVGILTGVWVARYLGPEQFGLVNYAVAFVSLFAAFANVGLNGIVVRDLVRDPTNSQVTMGTAFTLQGLGGVSAFGLALLAIGYVRPGEEVAKLAVALLSTLMVFKATDVVRYWFESQVRSKYVVWMETGVFLCISAIKIGLILAEAALMAFVWVVFAEGLLVAVGLLVVYAWQGGKPSFWRIGFSRATVLLRDSWPLMLSGLAVMVYMRIDQVMLGQMLGDEAVGIYTAAVRISEAWYFIPVAIVASVFPSLIEAKKGSEIHCFQRIQKLSGVMVLMALAVAIPMTFLSNWLTTSLFGIAYLQAGAVLAIHTWAGIFVFLGLVSGKWLIVEGLQRYSFYRTLFGAAANVGLNVILIPKYGVVGAAWGTVVSQACANIVFNTFSDKTRPIFFLQCRSCLALGTFLWKAGSAIFRRNSPFL